MTIIEISFDGKEDIVEFSVSAYKVKDTMRITGEKPNPSLLLFVTSASPNPTSKSFVRRSVRSRNKLLNVRHLERADKEPLEIERVVVLHIRIGRMELSAWFIDVDELFVKILVETFFIDCCVRRIIPSVRQIAFRNLRPVYVSAMGQNSEKSTRAIVRIDIFVVTDSQSKIRYS